MLSTINGILVDEANRLDGELYVRSLFISPWIDLIVTGEWPEELGEAISTLIYERNLPSAPLTWNKVSGLDDVANGKSILPVTGQIPSGKTLREYALVHAALQSEPLNVNNLRSAIMRTEQLGAIRDILVDNTNYLWTTHNRQEYARLCNNKISLDASATEGTVNVTTGDVDMPATQPTQVISNAALTKYRMRMIRQGAGKNPFDKVDGAPQFAIVTDSETSYALKTEVGIRSDLQFAGRANELLAPLGCDRPYQNFYHIIDDVAPRYNFTNGAWVEVLPYVTDSATFGSKLDENPAYESAVYTDTVILHKDVLRLLFPNPKIGTAAGVDFDPVQYRGMWRWVNVVNVDPNSVAYNPDGTKGFFRGVFAAASKPVYREFGYVIRHVRPGFESA